MIIEGGISVEYFPIVDENDNVIGKIGSDDPISDYKQIRFANAILFKGNKIIVPKRAMTKKYTQVFMTIVVEDMLIMGNHI